MQGTESIHQNYSYPLWQKRFCRVSVALKRNAFPVPSKAHFTPSYNIELADRTMSWARSEEPAPLLHVLDSWGRWDLFSEDEWSCYEGCPFAPKSLIHWTFACGDWGPYWRKIWLAAGRKTYVCRSKFSMGGGCMYHDTLHGFASSRAHGFFNIVTYKSSYYESTTHDVLAEKS